MVAHFCNFFSCRHISAIYYCSCRKRHTIFVSDMCILLLNAEKFNLFQKIDLYLRNHCLLKKKFFKFQLIWPVTSVTWCKHSNRYAEMYITCLWVNINCLINIGLSGLFIYLDRSWFEPPGKRSYHFNILHHETTSCKYRHPQERVCMLTK